MNSDHMLAKALSLEVGVLREYLRRQLIEDNVRYENRYGIMDDYFDDNDVDRVVTGMIMSSRSGNRKQFKFLIYFNEVVVEGEQQILTTYNFPIFFKEEYMVDLFEKYSDTGKKTNFRWKT